MPTLDEEVTLHAYRNYFTCTLATLQEKIQDDPEVFAQAELLQIKLQALSSISADQLQPEEIIQALIQLKSLIPENLPIKPELRQWVAQHHTYEAIQNQILARICKDLMQMRNILNKNKAALFAIHQTILTLPDEISVLQKESSELAALIQKQKSDQIIVPIHLPKKENTILRDLNHIPESLNLFENGATIHETAKRNLMICKCILQILYNTYLSTYNPEARTIELLRNEIRLNEKNLYLGKKRKIGGQWLEFYDSLAQNIYVHRGKELKNCTETTKSIPLGTAILREIETNFQEIARTEQIAQQDHSFQNQYYNLALLNSITEKRIIQARIVNRELAQELEAHILELLNKIAASKIANFELNLGEFSTLQESVDYLCDPQTYQLYTELHQIHTKQIEQIEKNNIYLAIITEIEHALDSLDRMFLQNRESMSARKKLAVEICWPQSITTAIQKLNNPPAWLNSRIQQLIHRAKEMLDAVKLFPLIQSTYHHLLVECEKIGAETIKIERFTQDYFNKSWITESQNTFFTNLHQCFLPQVSKVTFDNSLFKIPELSKLHKDYQLGRNNYENVYAIYFEKYKTKVNEYHRKYIQHEIHKRIDFVAQKIKEQKKIGTRNVTEQKFLTELHESAIAFMQQYEALLTRKCTYHFDLDELYKDLKEIDENTTKDVKNKKAELCQITLEKNDFFGYVTFILNEILNFFCKLLGMKPYTAKKQIIKYLNSPHLFNINLSSGIELNEEKYPYKIA